MRQARRVTAMVLGTVWAAALLPGCGSTAHSTAAHPATATRAPGQTQSATPASRAATVANGLSLPQQVAQLFMVSVPGPDPKSAVASLGAADWGGVVLDSSNFTSDVQLKALVRALSRRAGARQLTPLLVAATQEGGPRTAFKDLPPQGEAAIGATGDPLQARTQAQLAGRRLKRLGIVMTLAPLADVDIPQGPLTGRLFSGDPGTVARFTAAAVAGYAQAGVIAAVGHFPGSGAASADPDQMTATVGGTIAQLRGRDLIPFAAVAHSAPVILMSNAAYAGLDGVTPAGLLAKAVALLRHSVGFSGVVMSDDLDATLQPTGESPAAVALQALQAGDGLLYITGPPSEHVAAYQGVLSAAQRNPAVRALVRAALLRDLALKARYGVLQEVRPPSPPRHPPSVAGASSPSGRPATRSPRIR